MLTVVIGKDWVANREKILQMISDDVAQEKGGRILIVPELISHDTERRLCIAAGDTSSRFAEVVSFTRLLSRVSESLQEGVQPCLDNGGRIVAMASATRLLHSKLKAYAAVETKTEFLTALIDAVDEFKRCCISADDLLLASRQSEGSLAQKLEELALIIESYDAVCAQGKRDPRDQMSWLLEQLDSCDYAKKHVFYIDGFPDFTRQNAAIIEHLILNAQEVVISANCDVPDSHMPAFEKAGETISTFIRFAKNNDIAVNTITVSPKQGPLTSVHMQLIQGSTEKIEDADKCLRLYRSESVYDECLFVAEQIMSLVREGARYRDISVVCANMDTYRSALRMIFSRCHIPVYLSGTEDVLDRSVVATVLSALDAALGGFEREDVLCYIKSALSPLQLHEADQVENYVLLWNISAGAWLREWTNHPAGLGEIWSQQDEDTLKKLNEYRNLAIVPLQRLSETFAHADTMKQKIQALYAFFNDISLADALADLADQLDANADNSGAQILNQIWEILLNALEQMHDVLGNTSYDNDAFTRLFRLLLSQYDVGTIPPVLDSVTVGPVSAMRCQESKHLFVLGALEGALPSYASTAGVLTDQERSALRKLGVPLTGGAMDGLLVEFSEIHGVFCGAQETISVSCPAGEPSFIYRRLAALAGSECVAERSLGAARADQTEAAALLVSCGAKEQAKHLGLSESYHRIDTAVNHKLGTVETDSIQNLYGTRLQLSASQIDRFAECRFSYFLKYGLKLKERKRAEVDPAEFGSYVHAVLEQTGRKVMALGGFANVNMDTTLQIARECSHAYIAEHFSELDSDRMSYLLSRNASELALIVEELWQELHTSDFSPVGFEVGFGDGQEMDAVSIFGNRMQAKIRGFVDRVDAWQTAEGTYFRVVDYKTGKKAFDYCDVFNGLGLQMLLYLFALEDHGQQIVGNDPVVAGVQYFPARVPFLTSDGQIDKEQAQLKRVKEWQRKGLLLSNENVLNAMDSSCGQYRLCSKITKDGLIGGDVASSAQFALLKAYVFALLGKMVDEIASGVVEPNPYTRGSAHDACTYCPYGAVCHQASVEGRRNYAKMTQQHFWEEIEKEMKELG